jgi:Protein of unknown function (DUF1236)
MRSKLLIMSTAALLAGTLAAAGQSIQPGGGAQEKAPSSQGTREEAPKAAPKQGQAQKSQTQGQAERDIDKSKGQVERDLDKSKSDKSKNQGQAQREQDKSKSQTQGQAQRDQDKSKSQTQGQAERDQDKSKSQIQGQTQRDQDKSKTQTQGQAPREQDRQQGQIQRDQDRQQGQNQRDQGRNQQGAREGDRGGNVSVSFTTEQRTKIRETVFKERNAPRMSKVDFSIREGTIIPRTVRVVEVPDVIVQIHPEWRGFKYFIVDNELIIVESDTLRIVAVIDV